MVFLNFFFNRSSMYIDFSTSHEKIFFLKSLRQKVFVNGNQNKRFFFSLIILLRFFANAHRLSKVYTGTQARSSEAQHSYWASTRHILVYRARNHRYYWDRNGVR